MEPSLPKGSQVVVVSLPPTELRPGDIVLFETRSGRTIHRKIMAATIGGRNVVFHRGDNGGGIGVTEARAAIGKAVAILSTPDGTDGWDLASIETPQAVQAAAHRCRFYCWLARTVHMLGPLRAMVPEKTRTLVRKMILGY